MASEPAHSETEEGLFKSAVEPAHSISQLLPANLFPVAGHIDLLQWKFNTLYILDFKPKAQKEQKRKVATQLLLYALAPSCRTGVTLEQMRCAWFDEEDFFSFQPAIGAL